MSGGLKVNRVLIIGARQHAKVIVSIIKEFYGDRMVVAGFLDDDQAIQGSSLIGYPVVGRLSDLVDVASRMDVTTVAIGISNRYMGLRQDLYVQAKAKGFDLPTLAHAKAYVSRYAEVGDGVVLNPGVVVNAFARVGNNCVVYSNSTIEHETRLSDNVYVGPGVNFSSNAFVGTGTFIGAGSRFLPDVKIGSNVVVGAGSVVIEDVPDNVTVAGVPARVINDRARTVI